MTPRRSVAASWNAYYDALFEPRMVTPWIRFKRMTSGLNVAQRLWAEREDLRRDYEAQ